MNVHVPAADLLEYVEAGPEGSCRLNLAVPDAYCASCIQTIEGALAPLDGVRQARVNLDRRRVRIDFDAGVDPAKFTEAVTRSGYRNHPVDAQEEDSQDPALRELVLALVVSAFATVHTMFFSEAVWSGVGGDTRTLFYWLSALVAVPAVAYAGRPFFRSAWAALRVGRANMDVPIAVALIATTAISLVETRLAGEHAYFDASTMLLFFLLIGRTLDHVMRGQARRAAANLARLAPRGIQRVLDDGTTTFIRTADIVPGMALLLRPGERVPVDCAVEEGTASLDLSLVTGEAMPVALAPGLDIPAGALVLERPLRARALRPAQNSYLARTTELMVAVETARTRYRRIADRASDLYAPVIHIASLLTFAGWMIAGAGWRPALLNAVAVLIVTCPCALALAVPMVHVVAAGRLFGRGVLMKDGAALERLATVRVVAFDKTGTLTTGRPALVHQPGAGETWLPVASALAQASTHPLAQALRDAAASTLPADCREVAGAGVEARIDGATWRLGHAAFCGVEDDGEGDGSRVWLSRNGALVASYAFSDLVRDDALQAVTALRQQGVETVMLSGDRPGSVAAVAAQLGFDHARWSLSPQDKVAAIQELGATGPVAMVGDGINDAVALRAANVSFAPAAAADVGRAAADFVLTGDKLTGVPFALWLARRADRLVRQNLALSIVYNLVVLPLAAAGLVTPLIAAVAMSSSSLLVVLNALRLRLLREPGASAGRRT